MFCGAMCVGLAIIPMAMQRSDVREKYHLQGSCLDDILLSCCCGCCTLIQNEKESAHREPLLAQGHKEQYQQTQGMSYPQ